MSTNVITVAADLPVHELITKYFTAGGAQRHQSYPVVDSDSELIGIVTRAGMLQQWVSESLGADGSPLMSPVIAADLIDRPPITAYPHESARVAAERMASSRVGRILVVDPQHPRKLVGLITRSDLLKPLEIAAEQEAKRERFFGVATSGSAR
jgi:CBS domain-containing protein